MTESVHEFHLLPAIDLRGGRCVRLEQGSRDRETAYDADPLVVAASFAASGAAWVHVVDLDAAFGEGSNRALIERIAASGVARIQTGGGIRTEADVEAILRAGVDRVVIGTAALERPEMVARSLERHGGERIVVGLDARDRRPALRGWVDDTGDDLFEVAMRLADLGVRTFVYTDISRDGMFVGPNLDTSGALADATGASVIVSGGVGGLADIVAVRDARRAHPGIAGVIVGKAIYEGRVDVAEAVAKLRD